MRLCTDTITVFNAKIDPDTGYDVYNPTIISGVSWFFNAVTTVDNSGLRAANQFTIRIPQDADFNGKTYLDPATYAASGNPSMHFTLKNGDVIVKGAVTDENPRPATLQKQYADVVTILGITDNRRAPHAAHWKVVGS